jgi:hypothetical protein
MRSGELKSQLCATTQISVDALPDGALNKLHENSSISLT